MYNEADGGPDGAGRLASDRDGRLSAAPGGVCPCVFVCFFAHLRTAGGSSADCVSTGGSMDDTFLFAVIYNNNNSKKTTPRPPRKNLE